MNHFSIVAPLVILCGQFGGSPAIAAPIDTTQTIAFTCKESGSGTNRVERQRLATFILSSQGILASNPQAWIEDAVNADENNRASDDQKAILNIVAQLEEEMGKHSKIAPDDLGLKAQPAGPGRAKSWLFKDGNINISCVKPDEQPSLSGQGEETAKKNPDRKVKILLRRSVDDLPALGDDRKTAESALLAFKRERTRLDDGTRKTDSTLTIDGTLGLSLGVPRDERSTFLFATYNRQRIRTSPAPTLGIGEKESDKDIDVLAVGLFGHSLYSFKPFSFELHSSGSFVSDFAKNSQRMRIDTKLIPGFGSTNLKICNVGEFSDPKRIGPLLFRTRCSLVGVFEVSHILKKGKGDFSPKDEFVLGGGKLGLELVPVGDSGVVSSFFFDRRFRIAGTAPDVKQYTAFLGYRYWIGEDLGIDFGFDWTKGNNPISFDKEDRLAFSIGFIL